MPLSVNLNYSQIPRKVKPDNILTNDYVTLPRKSITSPNLLTDLILQLSRAWASSVSQPVAAGWRGDLWVYAASLSVKDSFQSFRMPVSGLASVSFIICVFPYPVIARVNHNCTSAQHIKSCDDESLFIWKAEWMPARRRCGMTQHFRAGPSLCEATCGLADDSPLYCHT